jgi:hypothetical protein
LCAVAVGVMAGVAATGHAQVTSDKVQFSTDAGKKVDLGTAPVLRSVPQPPDLVINRPMIPMADYIAAKNAAAARPAGQAKPAPTAPPATGVTLYAQSGTVNQSQTGNFPPGRFPPDGDIATGTSWMVQTVNDQIVMYNWFTNAYKQINFATFFGDGTNFLFDPRVIHDPLWDRFVVVVAGCNPCTGANLQSFAYIARSQTGDPTGSWFVTQFSPGLGQFWDFPQLGMDLHTVIATMTVITTSGNYTALFDFDKAYLYNFFGLFGVAAYSWAQACSLAPPYVLDNNATDYLLAFCPGSSQVYILSLSHPGLSDASFQFDNAVNVNLHGIPPSAQQPAYTLDTGDNRFENRSLQVGHRILNTATINYSAFPAPAFYNFDIGATPHTLVAENVYFASSSSYDWHPSIVANTVAPPSGTPLGEVFTTWMSTDPANSVNLQLRAGGWIGDSPSSLVSGIPVFTSAQPLTGQTDSNGIHRTGDYSYITTYPAAALGCSSAGEIGVLTGESAGPSAGLWATHVGLVKHC